MFKKVKKNETKFIASSYDVLKLHSEEIGYRSKSLETTEENVTYLLLANGDDLFTKTLRGKWKPEDIKQYLQQED